MSYLRKLVNTRPTFDPDVDQVLSVYWCANWQSTMDAFLHMIQRLWKGVGVALRAKIPKENMTQN